MQASAAFRVCVLCPVLNIKVRNKGVKAATIESKGMIMEKKEARVLPQKLLGVT